MKWSYIGLKTLWDKGEGDREVGQQARRKQIDHSSRLYNKQILYWGGSCIGDPDGIVSVDVSLSILYLQTQTTVVLGVWEMDTRL